jgi:hypothetical protein
MTITHLATVMLERQVGTRTCRDPSPTWCSSSPASPVTTERAACTCLDCLRAEASAMAATADATQEERNRLRGAVEQAAVVVRWVHSGAGSERAPRRILAAARLAVEVLPAQVQLLDQAGEGAA